MEYPKSSPLTVEVCLSESGAPTRSIHCAGERQREALAASLASRADLRSALMDLLADPDPSGRAMVAGP